MSTSRFRAQCRRLRQATRLATANQNFDTKHVSRQAGKEWVRHGGDIETYKKAWPVQEFKQQGNFFDKLRAL